MKKILSIAIAAALVAPVAAMADSTVYGKLRVASQLTNSEVGNVDMDEWAMVSHSSRLGIKGSEDLGGGLKAIYKAEFAINPTTHGGGPVGDSRNSYVGLAGGFGTFLVGRHDSPMKISTGKLDQFGDTIADYNYRNAGSTGLIVDRRIGEVAAYISPSMGGFTFAGALSQIGANDDLSNAYSLAGMYSNGPFYGSLAYEQLDASVLGATDDEKDYRVGLGLIDMAGFSAGLVYEDRSNINGAKNTDSTAWQLSGAYKFGANKVKAMYGAKTNEMAAGDQDEDQFAVGYQYNFSKRTDVQAIYMQSQIDNASDDSYTGYALQLNHAF